MQVFKRKTRYYLHTFLRHDIKASLAVFFVALPLCLGVALASNVPVVSGLIAGIIGGLVIPFISRSELSVSGPAAGLTAICAATIVQLGSIEIFFLSVALAGLLQIILGLFQLGSFTYFIPSSVIKGMLTAIGILLISKQIPQLIGYDRPDFWSKELINLLTLTHVFSSIHSLYEHSSQGPILISAFSMALLLIWNKYFSQKWNFIPVYFLIVCFGSLLAIMFNAFIPELQLSKSQFIGIPEDIMLELRIPDFKSLFTNAHIWSSAVVICFVAALETLLSITAIDKLDPYKRVTPQNRELIAQGTANFISGISGGLPITSVIVRSSANAEAGAKTRRAAFAHGLWLLLAVIFAVPLINKIPYCVLAVILLHTGFNLVKPKMILALKKQGNEQFYPFIVTVISILLTDLLVGVLIGIAYAIYFLIKHTYRAGFVVRETHDGHNKHIIIDLALNVSFLNKKRFIELLDKLPEYSIVEINGSDSVYIDRDVLEIFQEFKTKAHNKHIQLRLIDIPEVETLSLH
jgi:MFS superfamily sulfate permease-like transporter